ncbi:hypothetical protein BaRGS_00012416 [Batillaria attramentaria]|uniref:Uncharacterized protein n=1 Tax=Batillaria attramentaria TaxID=370345 RepID=A0ABD0LAE2_9CAEN
MYWSEKNGSYFSPYCALFCRGVKPAISVIPQTVEARENIMSSLPPALLSPQAGWGWHQATRQLLAIGDFSGGPVGYWMVRVTGGIQRVQDAPRVDGVLFVTL